MTKEPIQTRVEVLKIGTGYATRFDWERGNELELIHALESAVASVYNQVIDKQKMSIDEFLADFLFNVRMFYKEEPVFVKPASEEEENGEAHGRENGCGMSK